MGPIRVHRPWRNPKTVRDSNSNSTCRYCKRTSKMPMGWSVNTRRPNSKAMMKTAGNKNIRMKVLIPDLAQKSFRIFDWNKTRFSLVLTNPSLRRPITPANSVSKKNVILVPRRRSREANSTTWCVPFLKRKAFRTSNRISRTLRTNPFLKTSKIHSIKRVSSSSATRSKISGVPRAEILKRNWKIWSRPWVNLWNSSPREGPCKFQNLVHTVLQVRRNLNKELPNRVQEPAG